MEKQVRFKLQNLIFRSDVLPDEHFAMMYRGAKLQYIPMQSAFALNNGDFTEFFTYFNSFSYGKWTKYTKADKIYLSIRAKGAFSIQLFGHFRQGNEIAKEFYPLHHFNLKEYTDIELPVPENARGTVMGFQIQSGKYFSMQGGGWYADVKESDIRDIRISIATTTFKKESYIKRNVDMIERELFYSDEPCKDHFRMRIIDNGRTLDPNDFNSEYITLYPNINAGGAGGFSRGIIESLHAEENPTHILLMDDDVTILPETFVRTYALLAIIKDEYVNHFISGAMLRNQQMNEQHEDIAYFHQDGYGTPYKPTMFLHLWDQVFKNEEYFQNLPDSYAAWWYCCFPVTQINLNDLPLPIFIRGDDIDYGVRHKAQIITLNGIFVWHDDFKYKFSAAMEFYTVNRNALMTKAIDGIFEGADIIGHIDDWFWQRLKSLDYGGCELFLDAIEDYLKGPEFLMTPQGERITKEKSQKNEPMTDLVQLCKSIKGIDPVRALNELYDQRELKGFKRFFYNLTCNGHKMPKFLLKKKIAIVPFDWFWFDAPEKQYLAEQVLAVSINGTAHLRIRSRKRCLQLLMRRKRLLRQYKKHNKEVAAKYYAAGETFRSEKFWREYLGI